MQNNRCECDPSRVWILSESTTFEKVEENNIQFIGPSKKTMELMGDKITARQTVDDAGVPVIPGSKGAVNSVDEIKELVKKLAILLF